MASLPMHDYSTSSIIPLTVIGSLSCKLPNIDTSFYAISKIIFVHITTSLIYKLSPYWETVNCTVKNIFPSLEA